MRHELVKNFNETIAKLQEKIDALKAEATKLRSCDISKLAELLNAEFKENPNIAFENYGNIILNNYSPHIDSVNVSLSDGDPNKVDDDTIARLGSRIEHMRAEIKELELQNEKLRNKKNVLKKFIQGVLED